jgi:hypothetical protein
MLGLAHISVSNKKITVNCRTSELVNTVCLQGQWIYELCLVTDLWKTLNKFCLKLFCDFITLLIHAVQKVFVVVLEGSVLTLVAKLSGSALPVPKPSIGCDSNPVNHPTSSYFPKNLW